MIQSIGTANFTTTDLDRLAQELNRDGICVIRGLFDRDLIESGHKLLIPYLEHQRPGGLALAKSPATISRCPGFPIRQCGCLRQSGNPGCP